MLQVMLQGRQQPKEGCGKKTNDVDRGRVVFANMQSQRCARLDLLPEAVGPLAA